jgi:hypothetical protein
MTSSQVGILVAYAGGVGYRRTEGGDEMAMDAR